MSLTLKAGWLYFLREEVFQTGVCGPFVKIGKTDGERPVSYEIKKLSRWRVSRPPSPESQPPKNLPRACFAMTRATSSGRCNGTSWTLSSSQTVLLVGRRRSATAMDFSLRLRHSSPE